MSFYLDVTNPSTRDIENATDDEVKDIINNSPWPSEVRELILRTVEDMGLRGADAIDDFWGCIFKNYFPGWDIATGPTKFFVKAGGNGETGQCAVLRLSAEQKHFSLPLMLEDTKTLATIDNGLLRAEAHRKMTERFDSLYQSVRTNDDTMESLGHFTHLYAIDVSGWYFRPYRFTLSDGILRPKLTEQAPGFHSAHLLDRSSYRHLFTAQGYNIINGMFAHLWDQMIECGVKSQAGKQVLSSPPMLCLTHAIGKDRPSFLPHSLHINIKDLPDFEISEDEVEGQYSVDNPCSSPLEVHEVSDHEPEHFLDDHSAAITKESVDTQNLQISGSASTASLQVAHSPDTQLHGVFRPISRIQLAMAPSVASSATYYTDQSSYRPPLLRGARQSRGLDTWRGRRSRVHFPSLETTTSDGRL
ncbi:hypothetical protein DL93DRAFT_96435 [Clavulina sp. PMI_390]|nr:hypothetical protein DL93DRAFT_96435 [Clavulina sp. PMI_390]